MQALVKGFLLLCGSCADGSKQYKQFCRLHCHVSRLLDYIYIRLSKFLSLFLPSQNFSMYEGLC